MYCRIVYGSTALGKIVNGSASTVLGRIAYGSRAV